MFNLGGEQSGHIILLDHCTTGDGLVAAVQLLAILKRKGQPVSQVCRRFEPVPQILKNVRFKTGPPLADASVTRVIEDGSRKLGVSGRLIVRASGTEPVIRVMAEGDNLDFVERIVDDVCDVWSASTQAVCPKERSRFSGRYGDDATAETSRGIQGFRSVGRTRQADNKRRHKRGNAKTPTRHGRNEPILARIEPRRQPRN